MADKWQRTEDPTPRRLERARQEGQFPAAREFVAALQFAVFVVLLWSFGPYWFMDFLRVFARLLRAAFSLHLDVISAIAFGREVIKQTATPVLLGGTLLVVIGILSRLATTRMGFSWKKLLPDLKRLNPMDRLREIPRQNIPTLIQALILLPVFSWAVYAIVKDNLQTYMMLPRMHSSEGLRVLGESIIELFWKATVVFVVVGLIDLYRQKRLYIRDLRMSRQEIREELKETEGDPYIKARLRRLRRELLRRQMIREVPNATAVVTNPTHYAVALKYSFQMPGAPVVLAKGRNYMAKKIIEVATQHQVPIVENPPLARALYDSVEVGQEIPPHLYRAVAEVLAYVYQVAKERFN